MLLSLSACGAQTLQPLVRTELVEVPIKVHAPLDPALTDPLPMPSAPAEKCALPGGAPAVCALDALIWAGDLQAVIDRANVDRATARRIAPPLPKEASP